MPNHLWGFCIAILIATLLFIGWGAFPGQIGIESLFIENKKRFFIIYSGLLIGFNSFIIRLLEVMKTIFVEFTKRDAEIKHRRAQTLHREAEYHRISSEYWRIKGRTSRSVHLLKLRLAGELSENEYLSFE